MYAQFIKELIDLPDVLIQKVRKEEERWIFELSLPEQCPLCPVCLKRTIKMTGKKKQWMHGYAQRIGIFWVELPVERRRCCTCGMTFSTSYPGISPRSAATDAFQQWVAQSCIGTSIQAVARMLKLPYTTVERWFYPHAPSFLSNDIQPKAVCVDEFAFRKGHDYGVAVMDAETGEVYAVEAGKERGSHWTCVSSCVWFCSVCRERFGSSDEKSHSRGVSGSEACGRLFSCDSIVYGSLGSMPQILRKRSMGSALCPPPGMKMTAQGAAFSRKSSMSNFCSPPGHENDSSGRMHFHGKGNKKHGHVRYVCRLLAQCPEKLTEEERQTVREWQKESDSLQAVYQSLQHFRYVSKSQNERQAKRRLNAWVHRYLFCPCSAVRAIAKSLVKRTDEIISCILSPYSNGKMEGTNNKIKLIKRRGYGYRNIQRFALRVRLETANILS